MPTGVSALTLLIPRNEGRKARRLASAASAEPISDDENDDSEDLIHAYEAMHSIFSPANEMTKSSCVCVLSRASVLAPFAPPLLSAPSRKVAHRVSIGVTS